MKAETTPLAIQFGGDVRARRRQLGLSQAELGFRSSLHRTEISRIEHGRREPRLGTFLKLAGALLVAPQDLLVGISWTKRGDSPGEFTIQDKSGTPEEAASERGDKEAKRDRRGNSA